MPGQLEARLSEFVDYYDTRRYHESLNNLTPADVYLSAGRHTSAGVASHSSARLYAHRLQPCRCAYIETQQELLPSEYARFRLPFCEFDRRIIKRELCE